MTRPPKIFAPHYTAAADRYGRMEYRRCGRSGLKLPAISLGLWHNFGHDTPHDTKRAICRTAFDHGITHFDLANNYGPPPGSAEEAFGELLRTDFRPYRDEMIISSKAGYDMWAGPYGEWGSRKYLIASCDASLKRMGLDYVDIFYSHRFDPDTPLEETMGALDQIVRSGRALYVGISSYNSDRTREAARILQELGTPCLIHQPSYSILNRWVERDRLLDTLEAEGIGSHRLHAARAGAADRQVSRRNPGGEPRVAGQVAEPRPRVGTGAGAAPGAQRHREGAGAEPRADGAGLGAARRARDLGADRRVAAGAGGGLRGRAGRAGVHRRRAGPDRRTGVRGGREPLGEVVGRRLTRWTGPGFPSRGPACASGLLGGSFDPAHEGHAHITREALKRLGLDRVWWLVSPGNPLKAEGPAPLPRRMAAAREVMRHPRVVVTDIEARMGTRFTAETLEGLRRLYPGVRFVWLMGADNLATFDRWQRWRWIMEHVPVAVLARPGQMLSAHRPKAAAVYAQWAIKGPGGAASLRCGTAGVVLPERARGRHILDRDPGAGRLAAVAFRRGKPCFMA